MGDTRGAANWVVTDDPSGTPAMAFDAFVDVANDTERVWMNHLDQHSGP